MWAWPWLPPPYTPPGPQPTLAGFTAWVYAVMAVPVQALPDDSPYLGWAFDTSVATVNLALRATPGPTYLHAVYNLGGSCLVNWAQDPAPPYYYPKTKTPYWQYLRKQFQINAFVPGVINASADETTSESFQVLDQYKDYTLANLQQLKDPWGRAYLAAAADVGPFWGIS